MRESCESVRECIRRGCQEEEQQFAVRGFGALLGFREEAGAFVEVDKVGGAFAVAVVKPDGFVVDAGVVGLVLAGETGARDGQQVSQFIAERLEVGPFMGGAGALAYHAGGIDAPKWTGFRRPAEHSRGGCATGRDWEHAIVL